MECDICWEVHYTRSEHVKFRRIQCNISHELREMSSEIDISMLNVQIFFYLNLTVYRCFSRQVQSTHL